MDTITKAEQMIDKFGVNASAACRMEIKKAGRVGNMDSKRFYEEVLEYITRMQK